jgi:hypothetical protein
MDPVRHIFTKLLGEGNPSVQRIAEVVSQVLRRNEEARIYHWYKATGQFPQRRPQPAPRPCPSPQPRGRPKKN